MILKQCGRDDVLDRDLFVLELLSPADFPVELSLPSPRFACLIAWDSRDASVDEVASIAQTLLDSGAVYVCAWGPDCERVHDIVDEIEVGLNSPTVVDRVVMTTWHSDEPLAEAIWFVLMNSFPDEGYEDGCGSTVGIAIGSPMWAEELRNAFATPREFVERQLRGD